jgi:hypothetical protein
MFLNFRIRTFAFNKILKFKILFLYSIVQENLKFKSQSIFPKKPSKSQKIL